MLCCIVLFVCACVSCCVVLTVCALDCVELRCVLLCCVVLCSVVLCSGVLCCVCFSLVLLLCPLSHTSIRHAHATQKFYEKCSHMCEVRLLVNGPKDFKVYSKYWLFQLGTKNCLLYCSKRDHNLNGMGKFKRKTQIQ